MAEAYSRSHFTLVEKISWLSLNKLFFNSSHMTKIMENTSKVDHWI